MVLLLLLRRGFLCRRVLALGADNLGFVDLLRAGGQGRGVERQDRAVVEGLQQNLFYVGPVRVAGMELDSDETGEGAVPFIVVDEDRGSSAVHLVFKAVAASDHGELVPLRGICDHTRPLAHLPALAGWVHDDVDAVVAKNAAAAFLVCHRGVDFGGVDVALITEDGPRRDFGQAAAAVLDAGVVVADNADRGAQFEVSGRALPDKERIGFRAAGFASADDYAVLDLPEAGLSVPAGEVLSIEEWDEAVLSECRQAAGEQQSAEEFHRGAPTMAASEPKSIFTCGGAKWPFF